MRYRTLTGDRKQDRRGFRERLSFLDSEHEKISQYAFQLRLILSDSEGRDNLRRLCEEAGISPPTRVDIPTEYGGFFAAEEIQLSREWINKFDWPIRFQLEALLRNALVNTGDLYLISGLVEDLVEEQPAHSADFLRRFSERVKSKSAGVSVLQCFQAALEDEQKGLFKLAETDPDIPNTKGLVKCAHAIITPTRILLEGPYDTQSNRIVRRYHDYRDNFIRVEFREENRMPFRWPVDVRMLLHPANVDSQPYPGQREVSCRDALWDHLEERL